MHVEVRDPEDKIILSKVYSSEGKWTFTSHTPGEHVICLYTNSTKWFSGTQLVSFSRFIFNCISAMSLLEGLAILFAGKVNGHQQPAFLF